MACGLKTALDAADILKQRQRNDIAIVLVGDGAQREALQREAARGFEQCYFYRTPSQDGNTVVGGLQQRQFSSLEKDRFIYYGHAFQDF